MAALEVGYVPPCPEGQEEMKLELEKETTGFRKYSLPAFDTDGSIVSSAAVITDWSSRLKPSAFGLYRRLAR